MQGGDRNNYHVMNCLPRIAIVYVFISIESKYLLLSANSAIAS